MKQQSKQKQEYLPYLTYLYASNEGVFQMINQYLYQIIVLEDDRLIKVLKRMMSKEINHLLLIGKYLNQAGVYPTFATFLAKKERYWNAYDLYYDKDKNTILEIDIDQKKRAIQNYQMFKSQIQDDNLNSLINTILEDEYHHLEELNKQI